MGFDSAAESSGYGSSIIVGRGEDEGINLTGFDQCLILPSTSTTTFSSCVNKQYSLQQHNQQQQRLQQHISITQSLPPPLLNVHQQSPSTPSTASSSSSTSPSLSKVSEKWRIIRLNVKRTILLPKVNLGTDKRFCQNFHRDNRPKSLSLQHQCCSSFNSLSHTLSTRTSTIGQNSARKSS